MAVAVSCRLITRRVVRTIFISSDYVRKEIAPFVFTQALEPPLVWKYINWFPSNSPGVADTSRHILVFRFPLNF